MSESNEQGDNVRRLCHPERKVARVGSLALEEPDLLDRVHDSQPSSISRLGASVWCNVIVCGRSLGAGTAIELFQGGLTSRWSGRHQRLDW